MNILNTRICIPVTDKNGLESTVSEHFGRAPFHIVVDINTGDCSYLEKQGTCDETTHGHCLPVDLLIEHKVTVVACKGIGKGAANRLASQDINLFATTGNVVKEVITSFTQHKLSPVSEENLCSHHSHHSH